MSSENSVVGFALMSLKSWNLCFRLLKRPHKKDALHNYGNNFFDFQLRSSRHQRSPHVADEGKITEENKDMEKRLKKIMDRKKSKSRGPDRYVVFGVRSKLCPKVVAGLLL